LARNAEVCSGGHIKELKPGQKLSKSTTSPRKKGGDEKKKGHELRKEIQEGRKSKK